MKPQIKYLSAYHITRHYGGSEEGGWWYNHKDHLASIKVKVKPVFSKNLNDVCFYASNVIGRYKKRVNKFIEDTIVDDSMDYFIEEKPKQEQSKRQTLLRVIKFSSYHLVHNHSKY